MRPSDAHGAPVTSQPPPLPQNDQSAAISSAGFTHGPIDQTPLGDATRRAALNAVARSYGHANWLLYVQASGLKPHTRALFDAIAAAITPLQAALTAALELHKPDGSDCARCFDSHENTIPWPCDTVAAALRPLDLPEDDVALIREQLCEFHAQIAERYNGAKAYRFRRTP